MGLLNNYLSRKFSNSNKTDDSGPSSDTALNMTMDSYHKGGKVRKTGPAVLKKGEHVLTKTQYKKLSSEKSSGKGK